MHVKMLKFQSVQSTFLLIKSVNIKNLLVFMDQILALLCSLGCVEGKQGIAFINSCSDCKAIKPSHKGNEKCLKRNSQHFTG